MKPTATTALAERRGSALAPYPALTGTEPCRGTDCEDWFTKAGRSRAIDACQCCPLQLACLAYALDHPFETAHGVWAGTTPNRRRTLRRAYDLADTPDTDTDSE
jgi:hypothetical protein